MGLNVFHFLQIVSLLRSEQLQYIKSVRAKRMHNTYHKNYYSNFVIGNSVIRVPQLCRNKTISENLRREARKLHEDFNVLIKLCSF